MIYLFETPQPVVARIVLGVRERELQDQSQNDGFESTWTNNFVKMFLHPLNHSSSCTSMRVALFQDSIKLYTVNYLVFATCLWHDLFI